MKPKDKAWKVYPKTAGRIPKTVKRKKKSPTKNLKSECDKLYQELGRKMYKTSYSGREYSCLHHHVPKSRSSALRYEIKNGVPISAGEHVQWHAGSDPDIEFEYKIFMEQQWGENWEIELRQQRIANQYIKTNKEWYLANKEYLQHMINNCE
jgi:hypothetical protein